MTTYLVKNLEAYQEEPDLTAGWQSGRQISGEVQNFKSLLYIEIFNFPHFLVQVQHFSTSLMHFYQTNTTTKSFYRQWNFVKLCDFFIDPNHSLLLQWMIPYKKNIGGSNIWRMVENVRLARLSWRNHTGISIRLLCSFDVGLAVTNSMVCSLVLLLVWHISALPLSLHEHVFAVQKY